MATTVGLVAMALSAVVAAGPAAAQPPSAPSITSPVSGAGEANPSVTVAGQADAGSAVGVLDNGSLVASTTADSTGAWSTPVNLVQGTDNLTAIEGLAGQVSPQSAVVAVTVDSNELTVNGDFSSPADDQFPGSTIPGWTAASAIYPSQVSTCQIELPNRDDGGFTSIPPYGNTTQMAELAPNCVSGVATQLATVPGTQYVVSFGFIARPDTTASQNTMSVNWNGGYLAGADQTGSGLQGTSSWVTYQYAVTATSAETTLEFDDTNPVASDTVGDELTGVSVLPAAAVYPNSSWTTAQTIAPNAPVQEPIDFTGESVWYDFPVQPGQQVQVSLSNLPADYEIGLYSDIGQAYAADASSSPNLAALGAETPGAAFSNSAFSNSAFSNSAFSNSAFSNSAFSNSAFSNSAFSNSAFSNSAFSNSAFSNSAFSEAYSAAEFNSLEAISTTSGAVDKSVVADTWNNTGNFYVRVTGNNGAAAPFLPFTLTVTTSAGSCVNSGGNPIQLSDFSTDSTISAPSSPAYQTVIVDNSQAMPAVGSGYSGASALYPSLVKLAAATDGALVDVSQSQQVDDLANQAAQYPQCPFAEDLEAEAIQNIINSYRVTPTNLQYVVIVGDDDVIPFFRYPDQAGIAPESDYEPPLASTSAANAALQTPDYLSDDQYGAANVLTIQGNPVPLPTAAVGRLVETPADILGTITDYLGGSTVINPKSSLVTGYDFMQPPASQVETAFAAGLNKPGDTNTTLISADGTPTSSSWTAQDLTTDLEGSHYDLTFLGGHFSANNLLAADDTSTITTNQFAGLIGSNLENSLVISAGCHSGYGIDPADGIPVVTDDLAWPQAFTEAGATLIAGTGYQYGDTNYVAYSDQLYVDLAQQLGYQPAGGPGPVAIGTALLDAEQQYLSSVDELSGIAEKALLQVTMYGLPMLGIQEPDQVTAPGGSSSVINGVTAATTAPGDQLGLATAGLHVTPQLTQQTVTPPGSATQYGYLSGPQGVVADPGGPVLPVQTDDVNVAGETLRGVGFLGGTYTDATAANPLLTGDPATETGNSNVVPFSSPVLLPQTMWNPNYFSTLLNGGDTDLSFNPVQYQSISGQATPDARTYSGLDVQLFYSNDTSTFGSNIPSLASPPAISNVTSSTSGDVVDVSAHVTGDPAAGIQSVWVTFTGTGSGAPLYGSWQSVQLTQDKTDSTLWTGSYTDASGAQTSADPAADSVFMVQAANGVGEVTLDNDNGNYFIPTVTAGSVTPPASNSYSLQLSGVTSGVYAGSASASATLTASPSDPSGNVAGQPITFALAGESVTVPTNSNGVAQASIPITAGPGAYDLTASFAGDFQDSPTSTVEGFQIGKTATQLVLAAPAQITPGVASGATATLTSGGQPLAQKSVFFVLSDPNGLVVATHEDATNSSGVAAVGPLAVSPDQLGPGYTLSAYFGSSGVPLLGGGTYNAADSDYSDSTASQAVTVDKVGTGVTVGGAGGAVTGQGVSLTATVTPTVGGTGTPTGAVEFFETPPGGTQTSIAGCTAEPLSSESPPTATCPTTFAAAGSYAVSATYAGSGYFTGSSGNGQETVGLAGSNTALSGTGSVVTGQGVTFSAAVTAAAPGAGIPTGDVEFFETPSGGIQTAIAGCTAVPLSQTAPASASCPTSLSAAGSPYAISAQYVGDSNFGGSTGSGVETVTESATATTLAGPATSKYGAPILVKAKVAPSGSGAGVPTGTVTFYDNGSVVGSAPLTSSGGSVGASATISGLQAGVNSLSATYSGDANFATSTGTAKDRVQVTQTISGTYAGSLVVGPGQTVRVTGRVTGSVAVDSTGALIVQGGTINGSIAAQGASGITLCRATIDGTVHLGDSNGFVLIGGTGCALNVIKGSATVRANTGGVEIADTNFKGNLTVTNNTGDLPVQQNGVFPPTEIAGDTIHGTLACTGNSPPPVDGGQPNQATARSGQCAATTF